MHTFYKTELGFRTLKHRELDLNARQRRLLLLIGTEDFNTLNSMLKQRIADPELIQQLMALGLIGWIRMARKSGAMAGASLR